MANLVRASTVPFGAPIGWIAARLAEGQWEIALFDIAFCLALIGVISLFGFFVPATENEG